MLGSNSSHKYSHFIPPENIPATDKPFLQLGFCVDIVSGNWTIYKHSKHIVLFGMAWYILTKKKMKASQWKMLENFIEA